MGCRFVGSNSGDVIIGIWLLFMHTLEAKHKTIKTIGFTTRYRDKDKIAINAVLNLAKDYKCQCEVPLCKTSDSDVSKKLCRMESGV
jgi:hypothetical protein